MPKRKYDASTAVVLHVDLVHTLEPGKTTWTVSMSRPGRDGQFDRSWESPGRISAAQVVDLTTWAGECFLHAIAAWSGVQEELET